MLRITRSVCIFLAVLFIANFATAPTEASEIPTPESVLGFEPGTDRRLMDYGQPVASHLRPSHGDQ